MIGAGDHVVEALVEGATRDRLCVRNRHIPSKLGSETRKSIYAKINSFIMEDQLQQKLNLTKQSRQLPLYKSPLNRM